MPPDSSPAAAAVPDLAKSPPTLIALFVAFAKMSLAGFGGVLVWARRGIVDQHRWMTADEFNETFALCHFLPGPNVVNLIILAALYQRYGEIEVLRRILAGVACAAIGLMLSAVFRMMTPLLKRR